MRFPVPSIRVRSTQFSDFSRRFGLIKYPVAVALCYASAAQLRLQLGGTSSPSCPREEKERMKEMEGGRKTVPVGTMGDYCYGIDK